MLCCVLCRLRSSVIDIPYLLLVASILSKQKSRNSTMIIVPVKSPFVICILQSSFPTSKNVQTKTIKDTSLPPTHHVRWFRALMRNTLRKRHQYFWLSAFFPSSSFPGHVSRLVLYNMFGWDGWTVAADFSLEEASMTLADIWGVEESRIPSCAQTGSSSF